MRKQPSDNIIKLHNEIVEALKEDVYRDNPSKEILHKRNNKKKRREKQLRDLETKYIFNNNMLQSETTKTTETKKVTHGNDKYINQFTCLKQLKNNITNEIEHSKIVFDNPKLQYIYHTIETEKMNAADMYSMMKALQTELQHSNQRICDKKRDRCKREFEKRGGIKKYNQLKNYLTDIGVNVHEIN